MIPMGSDARQRDIGGRIERHDREVRSPRSHDVGRPRRSQSERGQREISDKGQRMYDDDDKKALLDESVATKCLVVSK